MWKLAKLVTTGLLSSLNTETVLVSCIPKKASLYTETVQKSYSVQSSNNIVLYYRVSQSRHNTLFICIKRDTVTSLFVLILTILLANSTGRYWLTGLVLAALVLIAALIIVDDQLWVSQLPEILWWNQKQPAKNGYISIKINITVYFS